MNLTVVEGPLGGGFNLRAAELDGESMELKNYYMHRIYLIVTWEGSITNSRSDALELALSTGVVTVVGLK